MHNKSQGLMLLQTATILDGKPQHIYITNDEEIKEGDWCIMFNDFGDRYVVQVTQVLKNNEFEVKLNSSPFNLNTSTRNKLEKIILTTDQDLIKDGVQAIDDEFLEWFVKNPSCEEVETVHGLFNPMGRQVDPMNLGQNHSQCVWKYKIIIPQEEPKQEINKTHYLDELPNMDKDILLKMWDATMPKLEPKQETLEEAAENYINNDLDLYESLVDGHISYTIAIDLLNNLFINGAKWQQEQDKNKYSEEDLREAFFSGCQSERQIKPRIKCWEQWFEQFKKK
jgi:hypothetical protein